LGKRNGWQSHRIIASSGSTCVTTDQAHGPTIGSVDLVGWSYSGPIVLLVALQHPELVHSLTIHEPASVAFVTDTASLKIAARIARRARDRGSEGR
jgi:pimeloyl-ACP methyl ester carboxylesterase